MANSILSFLLTIAMLLSGAGYSGDLDAPSSMTTVISDIAIRVDGEEYPISPSLVMGASSENGQAVLDFHMPYGEENLFPVQARVSEDGVSVLLGTSKTAYTFTSELLDALLAEAGDLEGMDEMMALYSDYMELAASIANWEPTQEEIDAFAEVVADALEDIKLEETTFTMNGEERAGQRVICVLTHEQLCSVADELLSMGDGALGRFYYGYINTVLSLAGEETKIESFADLCKMANMEVNTDLDIKADDECAVIDAVMHFSVAADGEPVTFDLPVHMESYGENARISVNMPVEESDMTFTFPMLMEAYGEYSQISVNLPIEEADLTFDMTVQGDDVTMLFEVADEINTIRFNVNGTVKDDKSGTYAMEMVMDFPDEEMSVRMNISSDLAADQTGTMDCAMDMTVEGDSIGLSFRETVTRDPVESRFDGATEQLISTEEELNSAATGLSLAAMGMMSDVEKLMNDPEISALADAMTEWGETVSGTAELALATGGSYSEDPADLPFPMPELTVLPNGFELTHTQIQAYTDISLDYGFLSSVGFSFSHETISDYAAQVTVSETYAVENTYYDADGAKVEIPEEMVTVSRYGDHTVATVLRNNLKITVYDNTVTLSDEELVAILNGVTFPEPSAEEAPVINTNSDTHAAYSEDPADLPFPMPELAVLPEGYDDVSTTVCAYTYPEYYIASSYVQITAGPTEQGNYPLTVLFTLSPLSGTTEHYSPDGAKMNIPEDIIGINRRDEGTTLYMVRNDVNINITDSTGTLSDEELIAIVNGVTFPEPSAEEAPVINTNSDTPAA